MDRGIEFKRLLAQTDLSDGASIERYAAHLKGMTFRDILKLGISPSETKDKHFDSTKYKGGMGNLLEERYFGYKSNSDERPDFPNAGVELKATCFDVRDNGRRLSAGERLVLSMIPYDKPIEVDFDSSHLWQKCSKILLVYYRRDKTVNKYDQTIEYVSLFTPPEEDLKIIRDDYKKIVSYIQAGRADELSEGLTTYLGAATKGATEAKSWVDQFYPRIEDDGTVVHRKAKRRAFSFKRQYMDYVLHHYLMKQHDDAEKILEPGDLQEETFEQHVKSLISFHIGKSDREISEEYGLPYTGGKAQWTTLTYRMLGIRSNQAEEFVKAGISVRAVRIEENGSIRESLSFAPFDFKALLAEQWDSSEFRTYLDETKFLFVVFKKVNGKYLLQGSSFWNMPVVDIDGEAKRCWCDTRNTIASGVTLTTKHQRSGKITISNNLPGMSDNAIVHVRPHAKKAAYKIGNLEIGNIQADASELPDGRWMTKQSFWFNSSYVLSILKQSI